MGRRLCFALARTAVAAAVTFGVAAPARAAVLDPNFTETLVAETTTGITGMAWAPDGSGRLFLSQKAGRVLVVENGVLNPTPFAVIAPVYTLSECGLIGMAFDPDFATNGYVYFFVTVSATEQQIIRYTANGNVGEDRTVIMAGLPTAGRNHDGGAIGFGPDGRLYWAIGDNGGVRAGVNDDLTLLASKVGRAERDGTVPQDNPFVDGDGPNNDYIWARGVRNPFTLTFQPKTGQLWLNVVGTRYEQVFVMPAGAHAGWIQYESNQPDGFLSPVVSYPTNNAIAQTVRPDGAVRAGGVTTITTQTVHRFRPGARVTISGVTNATFDGPALVTSIVSPTAFSFAQAGPNAASGGGTVAGPDIGGCITGGAFLDSTSVPPAYEGNFFFPDFNSGRLTRVVLNPTTNAVVSVDPWGEGLLNPIDMSVGPDGDLYYVVARGQVYRARYNAPGQGIVLSARNLRLAEGGRAALSVRLSSAITTNLVVVVGWLRGDTDVSVSGATLLFTPANWSVPQSVDVLAAEDADTVEDTAILRVRATNVAAQEATVRVTDDDLFPIGGEGGAGGVGGSAGTGGGDVAGAAGTGTEGGTGDGGTGTGATAGTGTGGASNGGTAGSVGSGGEPVDPGAGGEDGNGGADGGGSDDGGCGCRLASTSTGMAAWMLALSAALLAQRRRRARN